MRTSQVLWWAFMAALLESANPCRAPVIPSAICSLADDGMECAADGQFDGTTKNKNNNNLCGSRTVECQGASYASATNFRNASIRGRLIFIGGDNKHGCRAFSSSTAGSDIAVVQRGVCPFSVKAKMAQGGGFRAVVIVDGSGGRAGSNPGAKLLAPTLDDPNVRIPCVMVRAGGIFGPKASALDDSEMDLQLTASPVVLSRAFMGASNALQRDIENDGAAALACADEAVDVDPANPDTHYHRANLLHKLLRWNEAFIDYSRTLELDPDHLPCHTNLPTLLYKYDIDGLPLAAKETSSNGRGGGLRSSSSGTCCLGRHPRLGAQARIAEPPSRLLAGAW